VPWILIVGKLAQTVFQAAHWLFIQTLSFPIPFGESHRRFFLLGATCNSLLVDPISLACFLCG
jgi:hypothetical protein